ncbi:MAG: hypothetical protein KAH01_00380, partial [Caldisericia bacterium]|nr:hypothetical protein [Caldisericia bacterium]
YMDDADSGGFTGGSEWRASGYDAYEVFHPGQLESKELQKNGMTTGEATRKRIDRQKDRYSEQFDVNREDVTDDMIYDEGNKEMLRAYRNISGIKGTANDFNPNNVDVSGYRTDPAVLGSKESPLDFAIAQRRNKDLSVNKGSFGREISDFIDPKTGESFNNKMTNRHNITAYKGKRFDNAAADDKLAEILGWHGNKPSEMTDYDEKFAWEDFKENDKQGIVDKFSGFANSAYLATKGDLEVLGNKITSKMGVGERYLSGDDEKAFVKKHGYRPLTAETPAAKVWRDSMSGLTARSRIDKDKEYAKAEALIKKNGLLSLTGIQSLPHLFNGILDSTAESAPEMAMAIFAAPVLVTKRISEQSDKFEAKNGRKFTTGELALVTAWNAANVYAEKFGLEKGTKKAIEIFGPKSAETLLGKSWKSILGGSGAMLFEFMQEGSEGTLEKFTDQKADQMTFENARKIAASPENVTAAAQAAMSAGGMAATAITVPATLSAVGTVVKPTALIQSIKTKKFKRTGSESSASVVDSASSVMENLINDNSEEVINISNALETIEGNNNEDIDVSSFNGPVVEQLIEAITGGKPETFDINNRTHKRRLTKGLKGTKEALDADIKTITDQKTALDDAFAKRKEAREKRGSFDVDSEVEFNNELAHGTNESTRDYSKMGILKDMVKTLSPFTKSDTEVVLDSLKTYSSAELTEMSKSEEASTPLKDKIKQALDQRKRNDQRISGKLFKGSDLHKGEKGKGLTVPQSKDRLMNFVKTGMQRNEIRSIKDREALNKAIDILENKGYISQGQSTAFKKRVESNSRNATDKKDSKDLDVSFPTKDETKAILDTTVASLESAKDKLRTLNDSVKGKEPKDITKEERKAIRDVTKEIKGLSAVIDGARNRNGTIKTSGLKDTYESFDYADKNSHKYNEGTETEVESEPVVSSETEVDTDTEVVPEPTPITPSTIKAKAKKKVAAWTKEKIKKRYDSAIKKKEEDRGPLDVAAIAIYETENFSSSETEQTEDTETAVEKAEREAKEYNDLQQLEAIKKKAEDLQKRVEEQKQKDKEFAMELEVDENGNAVYERDSDGKLVKAKEKTLDDRIDEALDENKKTSDKQERSSSKIEEDLSFNGEDSVVNDEQTKQEEDFTESTDEKENKAKEEEIINQLLNC